MAQERKAPILAGDKSSKHRCPELKEGMDQRHTTLTTKTQLTQK